MRSLALGVIALGVLVPGTGRSEPADPAAIVRKLTGELDLQTKLPGSKADEDSKKERESTPSDFKLQVPGARTVLWVALVVGLAFALWALRDYLPFPRRRMPDEVAETASAPDLAAAARLHEAGDDADMLAEAGRFAEAMHLLLLQALAEMRARLGITLADSLTSREIAHTVALPDDGRHALDELIGRVERVHFGAAAATADDYGACRGVFERLIGAMLVAPRAVAA